MNKLTPLIGAQLVSVINPRADSQGSSSTVEEVYLKFDTGNLDIHNPCTLRCDNGLTVEFNSIIGNHVTDAYANNDALILVFEGRIYLSVSLKEEDFIGPEAAAYYSDSGPVIVFNDAQS